MLTESRMLTNSQVQEFRTVGLLLLKNCLRGGTRAAQRGVRRGSASLVRRRGVRRHEAPCIPMLGLAAPTLGRIAGEPRFLEASRGLSGGDTMLFTVGANRYVGDTGWETGGAPKRSTESVFYMGPVSAESRALRSSRCPTCRLPTRPTRGSAKSTSSWRRRRWIRRPPPSISGRFLLCRSTPNRVTSSCSTPHWFHASVGGSSDRRMCTVTFVPLPHGDEPLAAQVARAGRRDVGAWRDRRQPGLRSGVVRGAGLQAMGTRRSSRTSAPPAPCPRSRRVS